MHLKRELLRRCLIGAPAGLAIGTAITIILSFFIGDGRYHAVVPAFAAECGCELNAVVIQALCSLLYGAALSGASVIWQVERWSILRQTVTHLLVCSAAMFPTAYCLYWMERSMAGVLQYVGVFLIIYLAIWLSMYLSYRRRIRQINDRLRAADGAS